MRYTIQLGKDKLKNDMKVNLEKVRKKLPPRGALPIARRALVFRTATKGRENKILCCSFQLSISSFSVPYNLSPGKLEKGSRTGLFMRERLKKKRGGKNERGKNRPCTIRLKNSLFTCCHWK